MLDLVQNPGECILKRKNTSKLGCTRTYYPDGYRKRAAGLCFKSESKNEVLLVSSSSSSDSWVIPGGGLEPNEDSSCAAVRELLEEAGVTGKVIGTLGPFDDITVNGTKHRTSVYIFVVTEEFDLWEDKLRIGRTRKWFPIEDAFKQLHRYKPNQESYLREAIMDT